MSNGFQLLKYEDLLKKMEADPTEFGTSFYYTGCSLHAVDDVVCVVFDNRRIIEVTPDNRNFLLINSNGHRPSVLTRWAHCYNKVRFATQMKRAASGARQRALIVMQFKGPSYHNYETHSTATGISRFELLPDATVVPADLKEIVVSKDTEKYRAFCKEMKKLKAVVTARARMGAFVSANSVKVSSYIQKLRSNIKDTYSHAPIEKHMDELILRWMETQNVGLIEPIGYCAMHVHYSEADGNEDIRRRIINGLNASQVRYLRAHCVTITESATPAKDSDDSNCKLLANAGLREVQVPSEAQVCR